MLDEHSFDNEYAIKCIEANRHNQITATYHLLYKRQAWKQKHLTDNPRLAGSIDRHSTLTPYNKAQQKQTKESVEISQKNSRRG